MKNYKVEAIMKFTDKEENIRRDMGDVFECTQERYEFLKRNNAVKLIEIIEELKIIPKESEPIKLVETEKPVIKEIPNATETPGIVLLENEKPKKKKSSKK